MSVGIVVKNLNNYSQHAIGVLFAHIPLLLIFSFDYKYCSLIGDAKGVSAGRLNHRLHYVTERIDEVSTISVAKATNIHDRLHLCLLHLLFS